MVLALVVAAAGVTWWLTRPGSTLAEAVGQAPADAERLTWTDWAAIRAELDADLDADSSGDRVQAFLDEGYDRDLTSTSALVSSARTLQTEFGFSPATLDWELLSQSETGAVVLMGLSDRADVAAIGDNLERLGYTRPDEETDVWVGGADVLARIGPSLTPELQYVAIDADARVVMTSDRVAYLDSLVDGGERGPSSLDNVVAASGEPLSAAIYTGAHTCSALAMGNADPGDQAEGARLVAEAGSVSPVTGFAMSAQPGGGVRVALSFESEEQARENADTRAALAAGPAPGQGGDFSDRFTVGSVTAEGSVVTLELEPLDGEYVISDLSSGPVLFATC